ncbi:hypothetical protein [Novosphingopyxis iocasae]|uniref:hypothetical protein n=1 Tax=Novosphingopyxis iocasae TaxID=2762729 RepID=UPI00165110B1|nr:hypothetical protein [Novosphingopyxis iocasae]
MYQLIASTAMFLGGCASVPSAAYDRAAEENPPSYVAVADQVTQAPAIVDLSITRATELGADRAGPLPPGIARVYVEADVNSLIRGSSALPPQIRFLADVPRDARGRAQKLKGGRYFAFGRITGNGELQLSGPASLLAYGPQTDSLVRQVAREAVAIDAPAPITGVTSAFHVPGNIPGEGETQIFLSTAEKRPIAISVLSRPGQEKRWSVSLTEIVDEAAEAPRRDTLLWYRLACNGLPNQLPSSALSSGDPVNDARAREDYQFVRRSVGPCSAKAPISDAPLIMDRPRDIR